MGKHIIFVATISVALAFCAGSAQAAIYTIDNFNTGLSNLLVYDGLNSASTLQSIASGVIGGERYAQVTWASGSDDVKLRINRSNSGVLAFAEDPGTRGNVKLVYGYTADMNLDASAFGQAMRFAFTTADLEAVIKVEIFSSTGSAMGTITTPSGLNNGYEERLLYFNSLVTTGGTGVDPTDVDRIEITLTGVNNGDYIIDEITVPEPATMALLSVAGLGLLWRRKK